MNYTKKSFTITQPGTKTYADNWEKTFRSSPYEYETTAPTELADRPPKRVYFPPRVTETVK